MTLKKHSTAATIAALILIMVSCEENGALKKTVNTTAPQQSKSSQNARVSNYTFDGTEGDPITLETATLWVANYHSKNPNGVAHFFGREAFNKILSKNGCIGIRIYYAIDDLMSSKLLLIGADGNGQNLAPTFGVAGKLSGVALTDTSIGTSAFDGTEGDSVSTDISKRWMASYYASNPDGIQAHFFGYEIIKQILAENDCIGIRIYYALNNEGIPQLLLVGVTSKGENLLPLGGIGSRVADGGNTVGDASYPCPSYCP